MKRLLYLILWSAALSLLVSSPLIFERRTHAEANSDAQLQRKISKDILKKVENGRGADLVRVIVQPVNWGDLSLDSTLETEGGSNIRKFKNFPVRVVTLPATAAANLAARNDVSYVSMNRDVRPLGHLSLTTGADQVRTNSGTNTNGL
ncbi:MAG TPA: hypothetical protein VGQ39_09145, partial [Pyrinomonadaceae bacterium]|nr:hypothetical protein [Pyrinomonadaceae bacterium]